MKNILKQNKGVSMLTLVIAVLVLIIITNVLIYNAKDSVYINNLTKMYNDISNLREKISNYYSIYGEIPVNVKFEGEEAIENLKSSGAIGANDDTSEFFVIDLSALDGVTLNYGTDYSIVEELSPITEEEQSTVNRLKDIYIINKKSHNIFYVQGVNVPDDKVYYTDDKTADSVAVDLRYVEGVKIPDGFYYCGGTKDEGIVISDVQGDDLENSKQGNQFVWVPVENFDEFERHDFGTQDIPDENFINTEPTEGKYYEPDGNGQDEGTEAEDMYKSVKEYKGFYIARYEAGTTDTTEGATGIRGDVVSKKGATVYNNIAWGNSVDDETGGAVEVSRGMVTDNTDVKSTLCYGVQWDAVMRWISKDEDIAGYLMSSEGKGNYADDDENNPATTGAVDKYQMKNIYDMAGNVMEWTMEEYETYAFSTRGGGYTNNPPNNRISMRGYMYPNDEKQYRGFRVALYLTEDQQWSAIYDEEGTYTDENGEQAYIPKGFQVSTSPYCNKVSNGLVVRQAETKDEYVWVEVPKSIYTDSKYTVANNNEVVQSEVDYTGIYNILNAYANVYREGAKGQGCYWKDEWYDGNGNTKDTSTNLNDTTGCGLTYDEYVALYQEMLTSVYLNGGFYIGRYEAGIEGTTGEIVDGDTSITNLARTATSERITSSSPRAISQKDAIPYNYIYCSEAQTLTSDMAKNSGRTASLPFGIQWDLLCKFLESRSSLTEEDINQDSGDWGNYSNITFSMSNGKRLLYTSDNTWITVKNTYTKEVSNQALFGSGILKFTERMNLHDIAGNGLECTLEHSTTNSKRHCAYRGGNMGSYTSNTYPASSRHNLEIKEAVITGCFRPVIF